ncbi:PAS domain-containing protein [Curvivirga sp.]|uniref:PAS domain-containing protein n=1 Tax=Curvivirga sp. TaxID=2856848 RepID=UPI003B5C38BF
MPASHIPASIETILSHKACGPLIRHWLKQSDTNKPPSKSQLDPLEFWSALPDISIHIYVPDLDDYKMYLAGDHISGLDALDKKGITLRDSYQHHSPHIADVIIKKWNEARSTQKCLITFREIEQAGQEKSSLRCILPLTEPEAILCFTIYGYDAEHAHKTLHRNRDDYRNESYSKEELMHLIKLSE